MAKSTPDKSLTIDHGTLVDWVNEADDATVESREWSEKCRNYYDSRQISDVEAKALKKRKQAPVVINRIKPKIDGLAGMERTNRTTARAYPRTPIHEKDASGATEAIRFVLQDNFYNQLRSSAWDNLTVEGTGGIEVDVKEYGKDFKIVLHHIMWDRIIYDPHSRRKDFGDARYLGQVVWMDYDQALSTYPNGKDVLETMINGSTTYDDKPKWMDTNRKRVKIVELYFLDGGDWYYSCFTRGGPLKDIQISPYKNEEGETEHPYEFASLFVSLEGERYGSVYQYLDIQDEINKRRSKALHLMSVRQIMLERGAVEDVNKTRQELAKPDGVIEITPGMQFELLKTNDMAAAQFNLLQEAKNEIDAVGYNAAASGKETKSMSGVALENRRMAGQTEIAPMFDVLKHLDIRVYRKVWNRIKQYWKEEKWLRVTDDQHNLKFVSINGKPGTLDPTTGQPVPTYNINELDVDIIIDDSPDTVTVQQEEFVALSEMVKSGIPIPPDAIIEASNLKNKDRILQRMRGQLEIPPEIQQQMQQAAEEITTLREENVKLKSGERAAMAKIQVSAHEGQQKLALEAQQSEQERQVELESSQADLAMKKQIQDAEIQLKRELAEAEVAIKLMQADADAKISKMETDAKIAMDSHMTNTKADSMKKETDMKISEQNRKDESTAMPNFLKAMETMMQGFLTAIEKQSQFQSELIKTLKEDKDKTITLAGIKRDNEGRLQGATATIQ